VIYQGAHLTIISTQSASHYTWAEQCDGWHLVKSDNLSVIQERVPSGCTEVRHFHVKAEQFFFILSGIATMELAGKLFTLTATQGIHVPAGTVHHLSNQKQEDLMFTVTSTPPSHGDRVEAIQVNK